MKQLRERLQRYGSQTLLTEELLTIILSIGSTHADMLEVAEKLLKHYGGLGRLMQAERGELKHGFGLGDLRVALLQATLELGRRLSLPQTEDKYQIITPADAARLVMPEMAYLDHEQMRIAVPVPISIFDNGRFCSSWGHFDSFEQSNGRWMSLTPFLVVLLMEFIASPRYVSHPVRFLHRIESRPLIL